MGWKNFEVFIALFSSRGEKKKIESTKYKKQHFNEMEKD